MINASNAKTGRSAVALKVCNILRLPELSSSSDLSSAEISTLSNVLSEDVKKHPWLQTLLSSITNDATLLSEKHITE